MGPQSPHKPVEDAGQLPQDRGLDLGVFLPDELLLEVEWHRPFLVGPGRIVHRWNVVRAEGQEGLASEAELGAVFPVPLQLVFAGQHLQAAQIPHVTGGKVSRHVEHLPVKVGAGESVVRQLVERDAAGVGLAHQGNHDPQEGGFPRSRGPE